MRTTPAYDLAIIGLGAVGSACSLSAARAGARVIGFDRFAPPHAMGSTHGETRIVREAIGEGAIYTPFAQRSFALWDQLQRETGEALVNRCGLLVLGGVLPHATHVPEGFLETTIAAARKFGIAHEVLSGAAVRARFPAFGAFDGRTAYFEPGAGFASPERVVATQIRRAREFGAELRLNTQVLAIAQSHGAQSHGDVTVTTADGPVVARRVVVCAGAWMREFLPDEWMKHLTVTRQTLHWFDVGYHGEHFAPERMPVFIWDDLYGFPEIAAHGGAKIATEDLRVATSPENVSRVIGETDIDMIVPRVRAHFPQTGAHRRGAVCLYTSTPDFNFLIDQHPHDENVTIVSACSGHGFKHSAAIGEAVALAALGVAHMPIPDAWRRRATVR